MIVLNKDDEPRITNFEMAKLKANSPGLSELELEMQSWHSPWRRESLEYYLPLGWSFGVWSDSRQSELLGYVLTQPLLFHSGMTQTLWVEHMASQSDEVMATLFEIAYGWARDKHFQQMMMSQKLAELAPEKMSKRATNGVVTFSTSKMRI